MEKKSRKDMYNAHILEKTYINGETSIKPYYYMRNGLMHVRYTVDRCIKLTEDEEKRIKDQFMTRPYDKQNILADNWKFLTGCVEREIYLDGIEEGQKRIKELSDGYKN